MNVQKRNGSFEELDIMKIITVLHNANNGLPNKLDSKVIQKVANTVIDEIEKLENPTTTDVQRMIENTLVQNNLTELTRAYIEGCYKKQFQKQSTELDESILSITNNSNTEVSLENSNKDSSLVTTQRDYIAGEVSKSIMRRLVLDKEVVEAHDKGLIHFHDLDYAISPISNCELTNLKDMFENGTMVGNVMIETPKSLKTAVTVATQIVAAVSSSTFGQPLELPN